MAWISWENAVQRERAVLDAYAEQVISRARQTFQEARTAIETVQGAPPAQPCSAEHIQVLRDETINTPSVAAIGYFEDGFLKCTSWGAVTTTVTRPGADFITVDGLAVTLRLKPASSLRGAMTAVGLGAYNAMVVPSRFVDIVRNDRVSISLTTAKNQTIATRDPSGLFSQSGTGLSPQQQQSNLFLSGRFTADGLTATAAEPRTSVDFRLSRELPLFLAMGTMIACCLLGAIYWYSTKRLSPRAELDLAIARDEFYLEYQPIVDLKSGFCIGAEALVRWRLPDGSVVRPEIFIPLAEETDQILQITDRVVDKMIAELAQTLVSNRALHIAINLSASDIQTGRILEPLEKKLQAAGIHNQQIWLEATERGFIDVASARATLEKARSKGFAVAIDDFGTGYSNLQYLQRLPVDAIKIDKSFVDTIGIATATSAVVLHIIEMTHELGLISVAEGVETRQQATFLRKRGVACAQGWLFSRPLSAADFLVYLHDGTQSPSIRADAPPAPGRTPGRKRNPGPQASRRITSPL
jgi:sensor c-di-GMP phosphodiesterase-like protein